MDPVNRSELLERYAELVRRIVAINPHASLLAVSKKQPVEKVEALYCAGHRDFAENYVQELCSKREWADGQGFTDIRWHLIGPLQRKKIPKLMSWLASVHSLDRIEVAVELNKRWVGGRPLDVYIEVNTSQLPQRAGIDETEVPDFLEQVRSLPSLNVVGLMTIPGQGSGTKEFHALRELRDRLPGPRLPELSMGMSEDYEDALRCGATQVRIGTRLFGPRVL